MIVSYEEIIAGISAREQKLKDAVARWNFYATEAQRIKPTDYSRRMAVAECALRAVETIRKGKRAKDAPEPTLARFAKQCRIDRRTLGDWCKAKTQVFDALPAEERYWFSVSRAIAAVEYCKRTGKKDVIDVYHVLEKDPTLARRRKPVQEYLRAAYSNLKKAKAGWYTKQELQQFIELLSQIEERILELHRSKNG